MCDLSEIVFSFDWPHGTCMCRSGAMNKSRNQSSLLTDKIGGDLPKDELKLPHKKRITYERQPFDLHWTETSSNNDCDKTII